MAKHYHRRHNRHRHHRHNPFGIQKGVFGDAAWTAGGALGALWLGSQFPQFSSGWMGVVTTGAAGLVLSTGAGFVGVGARAKEELLKGGLTATIIRALHEMGVAKNLGLGLYAPSAFAIPTASSQYLVTGNPYAPGFNRGAGAIFFPGPQGALALPPAAAVAAAKMSGMGFHRFRSRYAGNY